MTVAALRALDEALAAISAGSAQWTAALQDNVAALSVAAARHIVDREVQDIVDLGVELRLNTAVTNLDTLFDEGFNAALIAVGASFDDRVAGVPATVWTMAVSKPSTWYWTSSAGSDMARLSLNM